MTTSGVSSYGAGGAAAPPHFLKESTKSQTFLSVFIPKLLLITLKSHADLVSAPPLFLENDAPGSTEWMREFNITLAMVRPITDGQG